MLCIRYLKGVVDGIADGMGGGQLVVLSVLMCTTILGWRGVLGLLACGLGLVLGSVGFCEGVCMGASMLDIGRCEVLIGCVGASWLCKVASIFCTEVSASLTFSILAVWSGVVGFREGGRRCGLYSLSPVKNFLEEAHKGLFFVWVLFLEFGC